MREKEKQNMAMILDGKKVADSILEQLHQTIQKKQLRLSFSIILCGEKPESVLYTNLKKKKASAIGIEAEIHRFPDAIEENNLIQAIHYLNGISDGIIVQLPLPKHLNSASILNSINPMKDVDGLTSATLGKLLTGEETYVPATPKGIIRLLEEYKINLNGKEVTIINRSSLIGKPLAMMLLNRGATVTVCHKCTKDIVKHTQNADIVISGVGIPKFIKEENIKEGAVVIDVGITQLENKTEGDVDFKNVEKKASFITPVPGGIGPMTIAMLLENIVNFKMRGLKNEEDLTR